MNPFLRLDNPDIRKKLELEQATQVEVLEKLRKMKDEF